jgi:mRNA-degrading endonuclease RelE of RelBE toxin-antitoxin system
MPGKFLPRITYTDYFAARVKLLQKKYRRIPQDLQGFVKQLEVGQILGDQIKGVGYTAYKARISNSDAQRGKSGGYRIIYYVQLVDHLVLLTIYPKSQQEDMGATEIRQLIDDYLRSQAE